jgi:hypothetical protein
MKCVILTGTDFLLLRGRDKLSITQRGITVKGPWRVMSKPKIKEGIPEVLVKLFGQRSTPYFLIRFFNEKLMDWELKPIYNEGNGNIMIVVEPRV